MFNIKIQKKNGMNAEQCMSERSYTHCIAKLSVASVQRKQNSDLFCGHLNGFQVDRACEN